jgi:hypothetical protein
MRTGTEVNYKKLVEDVIKNVRELIFLVKNDW